MTPDNPHNEPPQRTGMRLAFLLPLIGFVILVGFAAVALFSTLSGKRDLTQLPSVLVGKPAPVSAAPLLFDSTANLDLKAFAGQPILVNFFASWCAPCRAEAPALDILSNDITIIGIAYKDKPADTQQFLSQYGNPFAAIGLDRDGSLGLEWGVYGVPESYIIGPDGTVILRHAGPIDRRVIDQEFMPILTGLK